MAAAGHARAPRLDPFLRTAPPEANVALLINPFYPKDPHASFGKHVLTPSLALTSIAGSTPPDWRVSYWDENLLSGPPPCQPFPAVVGITVHLTFAERAYELARWYRARGAKVVCGGLHVISCPEEVAPHADALAFGEGVQLWGQILRDVAAGKLQKTYHGDFRRPYRDDPAPRRDLLPRRGFLTTASLIATRGCHSRCEFCFLSTRGLHMPYLTRDVEQIVAEFQAQGQPYAVFIDNNLGSRHDYLRALCHALRPLEKIWSAAVFDRRHGRSFTRPRNGLGRLHGCLRRVRIAGERQYRRFAQEEPAHGGLRPTHPPVARSRHPGERKFRTRFRP